MSVKEKAHNIINQMTEEQLHSFIVLFEGVVENMIPKETRDAFDEFERGDVNKYSSAEELFADLGI